jgi:hypothetical protein
MIRVHCFLQPNWALVTKGALSELRMEAVRGAETDEENLEAIRQNWCFGSAIFKQELLQRVEADLLEAHLAQCFQELQFERGRHPVISCSLETVNQLR